MKELSQTQQEMSDFKSENQQRFAALNEITFASSIMLASAETELNIAKTELQTNKTVTAALSEQLGALKGEAGRASAVIAVLQQEIMRWSAQSGDSQGHPARSTAESLHFRSAATAPEARNGLGGCPAQSPAGCGSHATDPAPCALHTNRPVAIHLVR